MAIDPLCKKRVDEKTAPGEKVRYSDEVFHFYSEEWSKTFRASLATTRVR